MNKCLSLVHLTSTIGPESSSSDQSNSRFLRRPNLTSTDTYGGIVFWIEARFSESPTIRERLHS